MITEKEIMDKLYELPEHFKREIKNKNWWGARVQYEKAGYICEFLELPERIKIELFGSRPYTEDDEEETDGLFQDWAVLKMYEQCSTAEGKEVNEIRMRKKINEMRKNRTA